EAYSAIPTIVSNNLLSENPTSSADISVSVVDWQAGLEAVPNFDPTTSPLDSIRHNSDVKEVILDIPDIMATALNVTTPDSGTGSFIDPYVFSFHVENSMQAVAGTYVGLVAVRDEMVDVVPGGMNWPPKGIERDGLTQRTIRDFTAYNMFDIEVAGDVVDPPVAIISVPADDITISSGTLVHFDGSTSTPGGWPDENYEWDFDYDDVGQIFTMDDFGQTADHLFVNTTGTPISFVVALRVTDFQLRTDIDTVGVTVNPASWGIPVRLTFTEDQDDTISLSGDAVVADSNGVAHVIYCEKAIAPDPANTFRIKYVTYDGVSVSSPQVISGAAPFSTPLFGFPQTSAQLPGPSIAIDSMDELHAVWTDISGIRYAKTNGGIWDSAIDTFNLDVNPDIVPSIQVSGTDDIMIVWSSRRYTYTDGTKPKPKVHYAYDDGSGMAAATLIEFNNIVGGEPYFCAIGLNEFAMIYADDNPGVPGSENDCFVTRFQSGSWDVPAPVPLDDPALLRGYIGAKESSYDLNIAWSDVLASPTTIRFKHYTNDIMTWSDDYNAYDDAFPLSLPSPVRLEVLSDGTVFLFWSDTVALKERCLWVSFNENDDEATILAQTTDEIDPDNPSGERQINSTTRDGKIHVIWQDLRNSSSPGDPKQEIYYCKYE
ncbi:hypothetical protein KKB99_06495, partial [bacterium]|nr:hypothetical protein [bacterium]MBU1025638.1 hypothetical protein [bacterium]